MRKDFEQDAKLKADDFGQKRMIFRPSGFNFNDEDGIIFQNVFSFKRNQKKLIK